MAPLAVASGIVAADRLSKIWIQQAISTYDSVSVIPGWLRIIHTENPGAAFGFLAQGNPVLRSIVLIGVSALVLAFVAWALWGGGMWRGSRVSGVAGFHALLMRLGLSLILGGAMGNLYDRVVYQTVTDFIEVYHGGWSFPAFNVADSAITIGAILLLLDLLRQSPKEYGESARISQAYGRLERK